MTVSVCRLSSGRTTACASLPSARAPSRASAFSRLFQFSGLELNRTREPRRRMHPRIDGDEEIQLEMHAEHQRDLRPFGSRTDRVVAVELASVLDLEAVFVGRPTAAGGTCSP